MGCRRGGLVVAIGIRDLVGINHFHDVQELQVGEKIGIHGAVRPDHAALLGMLHARGRPLPQFGSQVKLCGLQTQRTAEGCKTLVLNALLVIARLPA